MDYKNGKIYKIVDIGYTKMYIGSTTQPLYKRFSCHKRNYISWKNNKHNKVMVYDIFEEFGFDNCKIELIEECPCENRMELNRKEGEFIRNNECVNKCIAGRTKQEYYKINKNEILEKQKKHYEANKDRIIERQKKYQKEHYNLNKDKINARQRELYAIKKANKDVIIE